MCRAIAKPRTFGARRFVKAPAIPMTQVAFDCEWTTYQHVFALEPHNDFRGRTDAFGAIDIVQHTVKRFSNGAQKQVVKVREASLPATALVEFLARVHYPYFEGMRFGSDGDICFIYHLKVTYRWSLKWHYVRYVGISAMSQLAL